ncbi:MAG: sensor histidine kinase [Phycisphaerales bacterium]
MISAQKIQSCIALLLIILGVVVIAGWHLETLILVQVHETFTPMQYNTALGFLCIGLQVFLSSIGFRRVPIVLSLVVVLIGGLTLFEHVFGANLGIDTVFVTPGIHVPGEIPGRTGANTSFCFLVIGVVLTLYSLQLLRTNIVGISAGLVGGIAAVSLWGYLIGMPELTGWGGLLSGMAVHTSGAMTLVSVAMYCLYYQSVRSVEKTTLVFTPSVVAIPVVVITLCVWQATVRLDDHKQREFGIERIEVMSRHLQSEYTERFQTIERLRNRWDQSSGNRIEDLRHDCARYIGDIPGLKRVIVTGTSGSMIADFSDSHALGFDPVESVRDITGFKAIDDHWAVHLMDDDQSYSMIIMKLEGADQSGTADGEFLIVVLETQELLADFMEPFVSQYHIVVCAQQAQLYQSDDWNQCGEGGGKDQLEREITIAGQDWILRIEPTEMLMDSYASAWPSAILFIGVLVLLANVQLVYLLRISNESRARQRESIAQLEVQKELVEKANTNLLRSYDLMEEFAYTVSHDLKAPLVSIHGFSTVVKADINEQRFDRVSRFLDLMIKAAEGMDNTITNILAFSKSHNDEMKLERVETRSVLENLIEQLDPQLKEDDARVLVEGELFDIHADRVRVIQVFQNLITNAIKYGRPLDGPHEITIDAVVENEMVRFSVSDKGQGIDPDSQEFVFGVFNRLHTDEDGAGIGLSIVNRAVCQHGGHTWVESSPGNGATFFFTLPLYTAEDGSDIGHPDHQTQKTVA